jgi:hypothetical protein
MQCVMREGEENEQNAGEKRIIEGHKNENEN